VVSGYFLIGAAVARARLQAVRRGPDGAAPCPLFPGSRTRNDRSQSRKVP